MMSHWELNNDEFELEFRKGSFNPSLFNHEAHLRLAFIHITKYGLHQAIENLCEQIARYDLIHGTGRKFSASITASAVFILNQFLTKCNTNSFSRLINTYPELKYNFRSLLGETVKKGNSIF